MTFAEKKELEQKKELVMNEFFELVESSEFAKELQGLCNCSDSYGVSSIRHEMYEDNPNPDPKMLQLYEDELLTDSYNFYSEFVNFVKKYNSELSRVMSVLGSKTSEAKRKASAENGKKGGRPRKKIQE